jgi:glycoside/pentoside/hexuronide:cation symporter, GPH family
MMLGTTPSFKQLLQLGMLRMPLALLELPLFVLLPKLYNELFGMSLGVVGAVLLATRLVDAIIDPVLGVWLDKQSNRFSYRFWITATLPLLIASFGALLWPPMSTFVSVNGKANALAAVWLGVFSIVTYIGYSVISISYQAWGAQWGNDVADRARLTTIREACGLVGVLLAAIWLTPGDRGILFVVMSVFALLACASLYALPKPRSVETNPTLPTSTLSNVTVVMKDPRFRWLLSVFAINGIASAIPATLFLFFVQDVVGASAKAPMFLGSYFLAGALGMPLWAWLAKKAGLRNAWLIGMLFSVFAFAGALTVERGEVYIYHAICIVTGFALGADLALPPALLSSLIASNRQEAKRDSSVMPGEATYFGLWNLVTKLNLALAAGLGLPLLQWLGYQPGLIVTMSNLQNTLSLSLVYAALPCLLKLIAGAALLLNPHRDDTNS